VDERIYNYVLTLTRQVPRSEVIPMAVRAFRSEMNEHIVTCWHDGGFRETELDPASDRLALAWIEVLSCFRSQVARERRKKAVLAVQA